MSGDSFQEQCMPTWRSHPSWQDAVLHAALGLGEAGEVQGRLKQYLYKPSKGITPEDVKEELADLYYYVAILAAHFDWTLEDLQSLLAEKLKDGHGWGQ